MIPPMPASIFFDFPNFTGEGSEDTVGMNIKTNDVVGSAHEKYVNYCFNKTIMPSIGKAIFASIDEFIASGFVQA